MRIKQQRKDALARINNKQKGIEEASQKPASDLHKMNLVVPNSYREKITNNSHSKGDLSTEQTSMDDEQLFPVKQSQMSDSEFNDLLNEADNNFVLPRWNVGSVVSSNEKLRQTEFVPTYQNEDEEEQEVDL
jgi:hypothetical protein